MIDDFEVVSDEEWKLSATGSRFLSKDEFFDFQSY